jgi:hypothetical protein
MDNYREFLFQEHHSLVDEELLLAKFRETLALSKQLGIPVTLFEDTLEEFLSSGRKPPKLVCKQRDVRVLADFLRKGGDASVLKSVQGITPELETILGRMRANPAELGWVSKELDRDLLLAPPSDVALDGFAEIESTPANKWRWALGPAQSVEFMPFSGTNRIRFRLQLPIAGTELVFRVASGELKKLTAARDKEIIEGSFEFPGDPETVGRVRIEIGASRHNAGESRFVKDERPLAYSVYAFEHTRA